jgi:hypothetical protein
VIVPLLLATPGEAAPQMVEICIDFQLDFLDPEHGDWWTDNSDVPARGLRIQTIDDDSTDNLFLNENDGCVTTSVDVTPPNNTFTLKALSIADLYGLELQAHDSETWSSQPISVATWSSVSANNTPIERQLPVTQTWMALAVGTWVFQRNHFNIQDGPARECCLSGDPTYQAHGMCSAPPLPEYEYVPIAPPLRFFTGDDTLSHCGVSTVEGHPAVFVSCARKWVLTHEIGHVVNMMRVGARESQGEDAATDDCNGDWDTDGTLSLSPYTIRGQFQKEFASAAVREGWADFFAIWAWNRRTESDCTYDFLPDRGKDFDLDGVIDEEDAWDCIGTPYRGSDPVNPPMDDTNWLGDMAASDDDNVDGLQCVADSSYEFNRATIYDVAKMFWHLTERSVDPVEPEQLADVYVASCPRTWAVRDTCTDDDEDELPLSRLLLGADAPAVGLLTEVQDATADYLNGAIAPLCAP